MSCVTPNQSHTVAINRVQVEAEFFLSRSVREKGLLGWEMEHHLPLAPTQLPATRKTPGCKFTRDFNHVTKKLLGMLENENKDGKNKLGWGVGVCR